MASEQREKLIRFYKGTEGEETVVKLADAAEAVLRSQKFRLSGFLDPFGQEIAETVAANYERLRVDFDGGYTGAERQRAMFVHEDFPGTPPGVDLACVEAHWNGQFARLSHRDVLGSLMSLGIERDRLGDLLVTNDSVKILCDRNLADYLLQNLLRIGAVGVEVQETGLDTIAPKEERCKEIRATVASLRVDAIAASGFGCSRSRAASDIAADKMKLNWQPVKSASRTIKEGDVLSLRGRGRLEVAEVRGQTKKGRTVVVLKRYL